MKKVLLIHYFFKPFTSNQSFRYEKVLQAFTSKNIEIDILTSLHHGLKEREELNNGFIYRVNSKVLMKNFRDLDNSLIKTNDESPKSINRLKRVVYKIIWPDFAMMWIYHAVRKGKELMKTRNYDIIITGSFPFSSHLVGYYIKKRYPQVKWIVDYIDPFSIIQNDENPSNNVRLFNYLNISTENKVNSLANKVIIQKEAYSKYKEYFPNSIYKTIIAPPMLGVDIDKFKKVEPYIFPDNTINIVYIGSLYKSIRNPEQILKILTVVSQEIKNIHIHFIGALNDCEEILKKFINNDSLKISVYGQVSREEAIAFMKGSDILLNISNTSKVQLPGKVVEYIFSQKKIINYSIDKNSNTIEFFNDVALDKGIYNIIGDNYDIEKLIQFIISTIEIHHINIDRFLPENFGTIYFEE